MLTKLCEEQIQPTIMKMDSQSAMTQDPILHSRTKHIPLKYHHIRDLINKSESQIEHVESADMTSDILTKPLDKAAFQRHRRAMRNLDDKGWREMLEIGELRHPFNIST
ncbi:hypothetical protein O6H91_11G106500 [Diphasiastrum complanatum]|uniref:Uncharacterized protein n=1 Tax=Diphasiastrum complanatum TaxID=34168 RepID=A0ACC2CDI2_DIPCM|nr:hypothetical protein O6H91_11G106500 [Diphasiastrum complanatum]